MSKTEGDFVDHTPPDFALIGSRGRDEAESEPLDLVRGGGCWGWGVLSTKMIAMDPKGKST